MKLVPAQKLAAIASAIATAALPVAANASERLFICHDDNGVRSILTVDLTQRKVTMVTGKSPGRCTIEVQDGVSGYPFSAPQGEYCLMDMLLNHEAARQFVRVSGNTVTFGLTGSQGTSSYTFDMDTGILDSDGDTEECYRPHS
jgi:hypothetical protein